MPGAPKGNGLSLVPNVEQPDHKIDIQKLLSLLRGMVSRQEKGKFILVLSGNEGCIEFLREGGEVTYTPVTDQPTG